MKGQSIPRPPSVEGMPSLNPAAIMSAPDSRPMSTEDQEHLQDVIDTQVRREELDRRNIAKSNKVAKMLTADFYITDKTFPFLTWNGTQLSVTEYYPNEKIAIDKFFFSQKFDMREIEFKKKKFDENGIKYGFLTPEKKLSDLAEELGLVE